MWWRSVCLMVAIVTTLPVVGQALPWNRSPEPDAFPPFQRPLEASGTVSLAELRDPLKGKALEMLLTAEKQLRSGETRRALEVLRTARKNPQAAPVALGFLGTEHLRQGLTDAAVVELEQSVQLRPGDATTQSNLAYALFLEGRDEQGLAHARKAVQLDPARPKSRFVLGRLLIRLGRIEEAKFHLRIAAEELPGAGLVLEELSKP